MYNISEGSLSTGYSDKLKYNLRESTAANGVFFFPHFLDGYDVVVGYIADDRLYTELNRFFNGDITDEVLMRCLSALDLGKQYVALTEKACKNITILKENEIPNLELSLLLEKAKVRRLEGNSLAKEIEIKYRRIGKYFDEILRGE